MPNSETTRLEFDEDAGRIEVASDGCEHWAFVDCEDVESIEMRPKG